MAVSYSQDLRDRVLAAYDRGMKTKEIAEVFCVSKASHPLRSRGEIIVPESSAQVTRELNVARE